MARLYNFYNTFFVIILLILSHHLVGRMLCRKIIIFPPLPMQYLVLGRRRFTALQMAFVTTAGFENMFEVYALCMLLASFCAFSS